MPTLRISVGAAASGRLRGNIRPRKNKPDLFRRPSVWEEVRLASLMFRLTTCPAKMSRGCGPRISARQRSPPVRSLGRAPRLELAYAAVSMLSRAARRPARPERAPRRTRATAPAHSNPSCKGAFFLEFDSFIRQNPHKEKRDPNQRSTLRHSLGPGETQIPPGTAVLASVSSRSAADYFRRIYLRWSGVCIHPPTLIHDQAGDQEIAWNHPRIALPRLYHIGILAIQLWPATFLAIQAAAPMTRMKELQQRSDFAPQP